MPIPLILGLMELLKMAVPIIQKEVNAGNIPVEKQRELLDAYNDLRDNLDKYFDGPEWQIDSDEDQPVPPVVPPTSTK